MDSALAHSLKEPRWVELARRDADGLEVVLLWNRSSNRVKVAVSDERVCHHLDLEVARRDALGAFYHPFAYAASRLAPEVPSAGMASRAIPREDRR